MSSFLDDIWSSDEVDIKGSVCDLTALFKSIKILDSTSSSSTIQVLATLSDKAKAYSAIKTYVENTGTDAVFVKIGFDEMGDNSADIERAIYKYLKKLLFDHRTPNIMRYVAGFKCDGFLDFLKYKKKGAPYLPYYSKMMKKVKQLVKREEDMNLDGNKATITLIEMGKGMSFVALLGTGSLTESQFRSIMFQTFYTLREFHLNKVRHNDIHLGNIWVNVYQKPRRMIYFVNDDMYAVLETEFVVKLYDFDRAAFTIGPFSNEILDQNFCGRFGMCENENERFDLLIVLSYLYQNWVNTYPFIGKFIVDAVQNLSYLDASCCRFPGRYCDLKQDPFTHHIRCSSNAIIEYNGIYNIEQLCELTDYFDEYLRYLHTDGYQKRDLPSLKPLKPADIPLYSFDKDVYISSECSLSPIQMANNLLRDWK